MLAGDQIESYVFTNTLLLRRWAHVEFGYTLLLFTGVILISKVLARANGVLKHFIGIIVLGSEYVTRYVRAAVGVINYRRGVSGL